MTALGPLAAYQQAVADNGFYPDSKQQLAAEALQTCQEALHQGRRGIPGVYLWGPVGRGKTWLMDIFYQSLQVPARRQHFHHFMRWVHKRQFELTGTPDPLKALAKELANEVRVLCFDELFVSDIGDATLLGRLFQVMFDQGVVLVCTSNQPPDKLYAEGYNRERFTPSISAIKAHMQVVCVDGEQDHRLHPGAEHIRYWLADSAQPSALAMCYEQLSAGQVSTSQPLELGSRHIEVVKRCPTVFWSRFAELCQQPLAAQDFIALCDQYRAILISEVPQLGSAQRPAKIARGTEDAVERVAAGDRQLPSLSRNDDSVRRFIALVDECYDRKVPLYLEAAVPMAELYTEGYLDFAFRRTLSRLQEMQLERFGQ
ncbi:cell division protein ZapE [Pseudomonas sp. 5P_3.1_Bac2]|uniref:cell division protein ZapE n=1 Tax=Pseudomonas sp. 5P_3.1_Bac2 TaxID=2971617 RepID=UPI0021C9F37D|nr:cell division protein ZapE [Pseudomonas sp. 5P_3.1_Bac2]MCU1716830.1 cell division protein ZapE [Pseudomonas sp. 5P_3.1_Bac2]